MSSLYKYAKPYYYYYYYHYYYYYYYYYYIEYEIYLQLFYAKYWLSKIFTIVSLVILKKISHLLYGWEYFSQGIKFSTVYF